jgi:hypothetical protein
MTPERMPEVEYSPRRTWTVIFASFIGFWMLFGVNYFLVGLFTETSVGVIAALAAIGEMLLSCTISIEDMLGALLARAGVKRKTGVSN